MRQEKKGYETLAEPDTAIPIMDSDVVDYILRDDTLSKEVVPFMYEKGILRKNEIVSVSRWGINFTAMNISLIDPKVVAIHEAGHAVVFMDYGARFKYVEFGGLNAVAHLEKISVKDIARGNRGKQNDADVISSAGGPIAQSICLYGNTSTWNVGSLDDFICLCDLEILNGYEDMELIIRTAKEIVEKRWNLVEGIAKHMLKYGRTRYAECMRIMERAEPKRS
jgi:hypothetical protein